MDKKITLLLILCLVGSIGIATAAKPPTTSLSGAVAELQAIVANLQTAITDLSGNATQQQSAIENEIGARTGDGQALWVNATEQQSAIDNEEIARDTADQALWTNATEQQDAINAIPGLQTKDTAQDEAIAQIGVINGTVNELLINATEQQTAIDAIQSGSATQFGDWTDVNLDMESDPSFGQNLGDQFAFNVIYKANTDGFIVTYGVDVTGYTHSDYTVIISEEDIFSDDAASWKAFGKTGFTMPVKAGDYWEVTTLDTFGNIWWIPLVPTT